MAYSIVFANVSSVFCRRSPYAIGSLALDYFPAACRGRNAIGGVIRHNYQSSVWHQYRLPQNGVAHVLQYNQPQYLIVQARL